MPNNYVEIHSEEKEIKRVRKTTENEINIEGMRKPNETMLKMSMKEL